MHVLNTMTLQFSEIELPLLLEGQMGICGW
jgi:hypothetical protein